MLRVLGISRRERQLLASVNVGVPVSSYSVGVIPDSGVDLAKPPGTELVPVFNRAVETFGADRFLLTNPPGLSADYDGLDVEIETDPARRAQVAFGGTAVRSLSPAGNRGFRSVENDRGVVGELFENPNASTFASGRPFFDRGFTMNVEARYRAPHDINLAMVARYQDGQPFARYLIARDLNQGPEAIRRSRAAGHASRTG